MKPIGYVDAHIRATLRAREEGIPIDGHSVWSFLDNLEWRAGYTQRFGLVWVDHMTQQRVLKDSAYWYRHRIAEDSPT